MLKVLKVNAENGSPPDQKSQLVEVCIFISLILPSMILSFFVAKQGDLSFVFVAVSTIVRDFSLVALTLFFLWRNGESLASVGWTSGNIRREAALGIALFVPFFWGTGLLESTLVAAGFSTPSTPMPSFLAVRGVAESVLAFVLIAVVAVCEETIFRGYLILRFKAVTGSMIAAILLSSAIFSLGHGYEGTAGVVTVGAMGAVFAIVYLWRGSLIAPMVMHFLQDFTGILLLRMLGVK